MSKIKLEDIEKDLKDKGWKVISSSYENLVTEMQFECPEGHTVHTTWKKLRNSYECPVCKQNEYAKLYSTTILPKNKDTFRVLALDQSTHVTGYAIFDDGAPVKYGVFEAKKENEIQRDIEVKMWLISLVNNWKIDYIGLEGLQLQEESDGKRKMGVTVFQTLARLQGILMCTCEELQIPYEVCSTNTWRKYCGVKGRYRSDKKRSMQLLIKQRYDITVIDDIADAIGIGKYVSENNKFKKAETLLFSE